MTKHDLRINIQLITTADGEIVATQERTYALPDTSEAEIEKTITHAGRSFAIFAEGIEKLGMEE